MSAPVVPPGSTDVAELEYYARALDALSKLWTPHAKQIPVGRAIFRDGFKRIGLCMGRRLGKSTLIANLVTRVALSKPYNQCIILLPTIKSAKKVYWLSGILKRTVPEEYIEKVNETEMIIVLKNGSYIQCTGADDPDSLRGTGIAIYAVDEAKDHKATVLNVITPGLIDGNGILIVGGTPPGSGGAHHFWDWMEQAKSDSKWRYFHATSYDNPYLDRELIDEEKRQHEARGESDVFTREYMAMPAKSIRHSVYGMFDSKLHVHPYEALRNKVRAKLSHWTLMVAMDPGSASVFAVLIGAVNNHTGEVVLLDEVYKDKVVETSIGTVWPDVQKKLLEVLHTDPDDEQQWTVVHDEAATWARVELEDVFGVSAIPTQKALNRKSFGVSLWKDLYLKQKAFVSDRCVHFIEETEGYQTNDKGEYIKERDHLLDCARYLVHGAYYTSRPSEPPRDPSEVPLDERARGFTPADDYADLHDDTTPLYSFEIEGDDAF